MLRTRQIVLILIGTALLVFSLAWLLVSLAAPAPASEGFGLPLIPLIGLGLSAASLAGAVRGASPADTARRAPGYDAPEEDDTPAFPWIPGSIAPAPPTPAPGIDETLELEMPEYPRTGMTGCEVSDQVESEEPPAKVEPGPGGSHDAEQHASETAEKAEPSPADLKERVEARIRASGWEAIAPDSPAEQRALLDELMIVILQEEDILFNRSERAAIVDKILAEKAGAPASPSPAAPARRPEATRSEGEEEAAPELPSAPGLTPDVPPAPAPVLFSAHYPREARPHDWQPLAAYFYRETAAVSVSADVAERFKDRADIRTTTRPASQPVEEGALITATPDVPGLEFNPPAASIRFRKDWHRFDFEFQATDAPPDEAANGRITFTVEGVIVADVPISIYVAETADAATAETVEESARAYDAVFCSYSHKDEQIVRRVEAAYKALGIEYLRDVTTLRPGQHWGEELIALIDRADIFQLFWSSHAAGSEYVEQEWRHALALIAAHTKGETFIRPVRWEEPMPAPPPDLAHIHFAYQPELAQ